MSKQREHFPGCVPNPNYSQDDWDEVSDNPELTEDDFKRMRPGSEFFTPEQLASLTRRSRGRPKSESPKRQVTIRLDADVLDALRATGPGWQTRVNDALREWLQRNNG